jgi:hypothetical protein
MQFAEAEREYKRLKAQHNTGALTEADFKARLQDLMPQDEQGRWWMLGVETGQWYVHDGEKWMQAEPPPVAERRRPQIEALRQENETALESGDWMPAIVEQPNAPVQPVAAPAARVRRRWGWVVVGILGIIGLIIAIMLLRSSTMSGPRPGPGPEVRLWADRDVIRPGECTILHWSVHGAEFVRLVGPGFDPQGLMSGSGEREVCLGETTAFRLLTPDGQGIETTVIYVR